MDLKREHRFTLLLNAFLDRGVFLTESNRRLPVVRTVRPEVGLVVDVFIDAVNKQIRNASFLPIIDNRRYSSAIHSNPS